MSSRVEECSGIYGVGSSGGASEFWITGLQPPVVGLSGGVYIYFNFMWRWWRSEIELHLLFYVAEQIFFIGMAWDGISRRDFSVS